MCNRTKEHLDKAHSIHPMGTPNRIWSVSAIHSDADKLIQLHDVIYDQIQPGDRLIYTGNYTGYGSQAPDVIDELLTFRRMLLAKTGMKPTDIIYLRGAQEEMLQKLQQLPFSTSPQDIFLWMLGNGLNNTLYAYGFNPHDGLEACRSGATGLTRWLGKLRDAMRARPGHEIFSTQFKRAAFTDKNALYPMLFVNTGIDIRKGLEDQGDNFWWAHEQFDTINMAYKPFEKVIRGYDPSHRGVHMNCVTATIDGGCGFGGKLVCAGFEADGKVNAVFEV